MGIPHLTRHLMPFSETVVLQGRRDLHLNDTTYVSSVVVDGPSLVYYVYSRLLAQANTRLEYPDIQPTCDQVSRAVIIFLLQLTLLDVKIENICFDGALPTGKRETRLSRLERGRKRLEIFRSRNKSGFREFRGIIQDDTLNPRHLFGSRPLPAKFNDLPENPFMVPTVFEDLKTRWNSKNIINFSDPILGTLPFPLEGYPWADITVMVPGEADVHCAYIARATGCAVLTNDSDLLLHGLGLQGSVVLFNSIETVSWDALQPTKSQITAVQLSPTLIAKRLGVPDLLSLAYELKTYPGMGLTELVHQSKAKQSRTGSKDEYQTFIEEYQPNESSEIPKRETVQCLDPRISELFCQYNLHLSDVSEECPHVYLPILVEDHARRSAWMEGRSFRCLAYSILNASRPITGRFSFVSEFVRRGGRIAVDRVPLANGDWIAVEMASLQVRLLSVQERFRLGLGSEAFWRTFALTEIFREASSSTFPDYGQLGRFLTLGQSGYRLEWADVHLAAQIQSVLYSLRMLQQLLQVSVMVDETVARVKSILLGLPPLHIMMKSVRQMSEDVLAKSTSASEFLGLFFNSTEENSFEGSDEPEQSENLPRRRERTPQDRLEVTVSNGSRNLFDLIALE
ncbi:XPG domain containing-domain-containing protein [Aspergillus ambiguus]|uniref:PIN and XPG domain-containing protein n=1 Tax=Aspergillus ambiguus TaxID=176160 RepID=UPI003CCD5866